MRVGNLSSLNRLIRPTALVLATCLVQYELKKERQYKRRICLRIQDALGSPVKPMKLEVVPHVSR